MSDVVSQCLHLTVDRDTMGEWADGETSPLLSRGRSVAPDSLQGLSWALQYGDYGETCKDILFVSFVI